MLETFRRAIQRSAPAGRFLLLAGFFAVVAFAQVQAPWQQAATTVDAWFTSGYVWIGGFAILFGGFELIWGTAHGKLMGIAALIVGLGLIKYHASLPNII